MRKVFWAGGLLVVLLVVGLLVVLLRRPASVTEDVQLLPDVSLQVNGEHELIVHQGTPLIFSVWLANQRAMNADLQNTALQAYREALQGALACAEAPKVNADASM